MEIPFKMNPWGIPMAASGEFRALFEKKSDNTAEKSSARLRHQEKPGRANLHGPIAAAALFLPSAQSRAVSSCRAVTTLNDQPSHRIFLFTVQPQHT